ncbi:MAG TPA: L-threonylcarbamoyladenylate synthase [Candidatus Saccharimonadales bacterium]|nr:L-threonylcarbamoyladenylate synthase [Candidatus Saccharimonadales bacterium]
MSYITNSFDAKVVKLLKLGGVGFMPSDTIYGLSCRALDKKAVARLRKIKGCDQDKPFIALISSLTQLTDVGVITTDVAPALRYWPGRLTIICDALIAPLWLHRGTKTLAVRQPDNEELRNLIAKVGPIISTSANLASQKPARSMAAGQKFFGDKLDFYVDKGTINKKPSTIIHATFSKVEVVRPGAVRIKETT